MISDGERREVAENIRYLTIRPYIRYEPNLKENR